MWCFLVELWKGFWWEGRQWGWAVCLYAWLLCGDGFLQRSGLEGHDGSWYDYNTNWFLQVCWVAHFPFPYYVCLLLLFQGIVGKIQYLISFWNIRFLPVHVLLFTKFSLKVLFLNGKRICISQVMLWNTGWRLQLFWLCSLYCWWWWYILENWDDDDNLNKDPNSDDSVVEVFPPFALWSSLHNVVVLYQFDWSVLS